MRAYVSGILEDVNRHGLLIFKDRAGISIIKKSLKEEFPDYIAQKAK